MTNILHVIAKTVIAVFIAIFFSFVACGCVNGAKEEEKAGQNAQDWAKAFVGHDDATVICVPTDGHVFHCTVFISDGRRPFPLDCTRFGCWQRTCR